MKYVTLAEFMTMPAGTLFFHDEERRQLSRIDEISIWDDHALYIKGENVAGDTFDWYETPLVDPIDDSDKGYPNQTLIASGETIPLESDDITFYSHGSSALARDIRIIVLDQADHEVLISRLTQALEWRKQGQSFE